MARIHRHCNRRKHWAKPSHLTKLNKLYPVLALLNTSIWMIGLWFQCLSHLPMICHQLWANLDRLWAMSMRRCFCSKFNNFGTIFAASRFMPKTYGKIAWNDMPTSSGTSVIVIQWLSTIIFFTASMFSSVIDMLGLPGRASSLIFARLSLNW